MFLSQRRKFNILLNARNAKLSAQRKELAIQRDAEETAKSIMIGSVEYAYNIQTETIGNVNKVKEIFPESFVYYQPRDIVSGDWYYATVVNGCRLIANADCTGHGIPGALLCILGVSTLKEIINKIELNNTPVMPGEILDQMRTSIKKSLNKNTESKSTKVDDGMDMTILIFPQEGGKIHFASANQSAILIHNDTATRLKGDSNPIGNYIREIKNFTTITKDVTKGDVVYIFSDGIQDQVGGPNIRKYTFNRIINFMLERYKLPMQQQMQELEADINKWTEGISQVDDRSMIGIRIDK
jgi:serine phosphatase RsbU (regulator of sigma subunit)